MYGAALPAGNYHGSLGRYAGRSAPSMQGATMRGLAKAHVLGNVGLRGLNGVDFCDPGWSAISTLLAGAGSVISSMSAASGTAGQRAAYGACPAGSAGDACRRASGYNPGDTGFQAGGSAATLLGTTWGTQCTSMAAAAGVESQTQFNNMLAQQRLDNEMAIANARMQNEVLLAGRQPAGNGNGGLSNQTLLIGAGVVAAVVLGAVLLRR